MADDRAQALAKLAKGVAGAPPRDNGTESDGGEDYA